MIYRRDEEGSFVTQDLDAPLQELSTHGRIIAVMYEREGQIEVQTWVEPTPVMIRALIDSYQCMLRFLEGEQWK